MDEKIGWKLTLQTPRKNMNLYINKKHPFDNSTETKRCAILVIVGILQASKPFVAGRHSYGYMSALFFVSSNFISMNFPNVPHITRLFDLLYQAV